MRSRRKNISIPKVWNGWIKKGLHRVYFRNGKAQIPDQAMQKRERKEQKRKETEEASRREENDRDVRAQEEEKEEQGGDNTLVVGNNQVKTTI